MSLFGCSHNKCTWPRQDDGGTYVRCLECGARLPWDWDDALQLVPPHVTAPRITAQDHEAARRVGVSLDE